MQNDGGDRTPIVTRHGGEAGTNHEILTTPSQLLPSLNRCFQRLVDSTCANRPQRNALIMIDRGGDNASNVLCI